jgi:predicted nucleic acid-binding protein
MLTLDTSALVALLDRKDPQHRHIRSALQADGGPYLIPAWILAEVAYFVDVRMSAKAADALLGDIEAGAYAIECGDEDVPRVRELVARYADLPLGLADAAVVACAERNGGRVLTLDVRDFGVVAKEGQITVLPG